MKSCGISGTPVPEEVKRVEASEFNDSFDHATES